MGLRGTGRNRNRAVKAARRVEKAKIGTLGPMLPERMRPSKNDYGQLGSLSGAMLRRDHWAGKGAD